MKKYGSNLKKGTWLMAAVLVGLVTACGQDGVFGGPPGAGPGGVPGVANPGPAGPTSAPPRPSVASAATPG
jgi:hypothetical protein